MSVLKNSISTTSTLQQSSGTPCLDQKDVLSIAVHGVVLLVVFQNLLLPLFRKRPSFVFLVDIGVDRLDRLLKEHTAALLNCIDTSLCSNREVLEAIAGSLHSGDRIEREASMKQIVDVDTLIEFCVQAGLALAFGGFLAEAAGAVLEEGAPLMYSLLAEVVKHVPDEIPEKKEIRRLKGVTNSIGVVCDHDSQWVRSVLEEVGGANDGSWSLLPYLFATFMASNVCNTTAFNVKTRGLQQQYTLLGKEVNSLDWSVSIGRDNLSQMDMSVRH
uniref:Uncharacterized protein n=1 Tax=Fagus sylvatica TaxID=28930 RepID=A0A2N9H4U6_FAGSY